METEKQLSPEVISELEHPYFELQASWGMTKHMGGLKATRELIELCHINKGKYVLVVGCGVGITACYIAKGYGCRVVGVDILERMVERANERAKREGVEGRVEFRVADAQDLPFEDNLFDVVIGEWITGLLDDKQRGTNEYLRVVKPGGCVGLNEGIWIKTPPPTELVEYLSRIFGAKGEILTSDGWEELLVGTGLRDMVVRTYKADVLSEKRENLKDFLRVWHRALYAYIRSSAFRKFIRVALSLPKDFLEYWGYGIYVGRK